MQPELPGLSESDEKTAPNKILTLLEETTKLGSKSEDLLILTPNQPLAQQLRQQRLSILKSRSSAAANIHVLSAWLSNKTDASASKPIASDTQLKQIWRSVLTRELSNYPELSPAALVVSALSAWRNLKRYLVHPKDLQNAEYGQLIRFSKLVTQFDREMDERGFTSVEQSLEIQLHQYVSKALPDDQKSSTRIVLYGFVEPPPPLIAKWLNQVFAQVEHIDYLAQPSSRSIHCASNPESELEDATLWAKSVYEQDNSARVGIIHTDLRGELNKAIRIVTNTLSLNSDVKSSEPNTALDGQSASTIPFSTSVSPVLSETGEIRTALGLLELNLPTLERSDARKLIHTPFWSCIESEYSIRANWDTRLCHLRTKEIKTAVFRELLDETHTTPRRNEPANNVAEEAPACEMNLRDRLLSFSTMGSQAAEKMHPSAWANLFDQQLDILGWPGTRQSENTALMNSWKDALTDFADLGAAIINVSGDFSSTTAGSNEKKRTHDDNTGISKIDMREALALLRECCNSPRTNPSAAHAGVRLLDTIEGAANYSHLWVTGLDTSRWPAPNSPNALLPVSLQRSYKMPRSDAKAETELAKRLIERISGAAKEVVFSYPKFVEDIEQRPTRLLPDASKLSRDNFLSKHNFCKAADKTTNFAIELVHTESAPMLADNEKRVRGGTALLRTMAASPFDAFVQWRLDADPLPEAIFGLDAAQRGTLVHEVLDRLWKQLKTQSNLISLSEDSRITICEKMSADTVLDWQRRFGWLGKAHAQLETQRLSKLSQQWLEFEMARQDFDVVRREERLEAKLGDLSFKLRIDRIDRLSDGSLVLIDYKTGQSLSPAHWLELPPSEPQLPLYAISLEDMPNAICFAQVRPDSRRIIGISEAPMEKGFAVVEDWQGMLHEWRESLTTLASEYIHGVAEVREKKTLFGYADPLAPLHRFNEFEPLTEWLSLNK